MNKSGDGCYVLNRTSSLSELTPIIFHMELTHLGLGGLQFK